MASRKASVPEWARKIQQLRQLPVIETVLAMDYYPMVLTGHDLPENVNGIGLVSSGFHCLGVPPLLGRGLLPSDAIDGQDPQAVVLAAAAMARPDGERRYE